MFIVGARSIATVACVCPTPLSGGGSQGQPLVTGPNLSVGKDHWRETYGAPVVFALFTNNIQVAHGGEGQIALLQNQFPIQPFADSLSLLSDPSTTF